MGGRQPVIVIQTMNLLFICSRNQWRSPTAERVFGALPGISARSAGTASSARHRVTHQDLQWADRVIAMEDKHLQRLRSEFPEDMKGKKALTLHVPDEYGYMDPELIDLLNETLLPMLDAG